jgi:hypothetical protein
MGAYGHKGVGNDFFGHRFGNEFVDTYDHIWVLTDTKGLETIFWDTGLGTSLWTHMTTYGCLRTQKGWKRFFGTQVWKPVCGHI